MARPSHDLSTGKGLKRRRSVILLSGGLDSATAAAVAANEGDDLYCLSFDYGQRHGRELASAERIARTLEARQHAVVNIDSRVFSGSALTDREIPVPKDGPVFPETSAIPVTYVPARNTLFLAYGLAWAEVLHAGRIVIGANALDYSGYPDCRPEYIEAFERMANLATRAAVEEGIRLRIWAPLVAMSKADIIRLGTSLGLDYGITWSCYDPTDTGFPCGRCDSCVLRAKGFSEAQLPDPLLR